MLALFRIDPSVNRTPKSLTPRFGQVLELCPLWLQCEHRRVIANREPDQAAKEGELELGGGPTWGSESQDPRHEILDGLRLAMSG